MKKIVETYFVETHEYNFKTGECDLLEYFAYEFDDKLFSTTHFTDNVHHTILTLAVM